MRFAHHAVPLPSGGSVGYPSLGGSSDHVRTPRDDQLRDGLRERGTQPTLRSLPGEQVRDRAHLLEEAVQEPLRLGVDAVLGGLAVRLHLVDAALQLVGALLDAADRAVEFLLAAADAFLDVEAGVLAQGAELQTEIERERGRRRLRCR